MENKTPETNSLAYSIVELNNKWHLVEVSFDKKELKALETRIVLSDNSYMEVEDQFKIHTSENLFR